MSRKMSYLFSLVTLLTVCILKAPPLAFAQEDQPERQNSKIVRGRNLALYDFGGRQGCEGFYFESEPEHALCEASIEKARDFIWLHWQEKRRGYIIVSLASRDALSNAHIFTEPDKKGGWRVVWQWERIYGIGDGMRGKIDYMPEIISIERKLASERDYRFKTGTSYLSFIGGGGKELTSL